MSRLSAPLSPLVRKFFDKIDAADPYDSINKRSREQFLDLQGESVVLYNPTLGSLKGRPALDKMWKACSQCFLTIKLEKFEVLAKTIGYA
jgi:hypothetical protein